MSKRCIFDEDLWKLHFDNRRKGIPPAIRDSILFEKTMPVFVYQDKKYNKFNVNINDSSQVYFLQSPNITFDTREQINFYDFVAIVGNPQIKLYSNNKLIHDGQKSTSEHKQNLIVIPTIMLLYCILEVEGNYKRTDGVDGPGLFVGLFSYPFWYKFVLSSTKHEPLSPYIPRPVLYHCGVFFISGPNNEVIDVVYHIIIPPLFHLKNGFMHTFET